MKTINKLSTFDPIADARKNKDFQRYSQDAAIRIRLASEVYSARESQHLNQQELARKIHSTQKVISNIENGDVNIGLDLLNRLVTNLNFTPDQLATIFNRTIDFKYEIKTTSHKSEKGSTVFGSTPHYSLNR